MFGLLIALTYKNSETYKMIHGEGNKETDSEKRDTYSRSTKNDNTNDNNSVNTDLTEPKSESNEKENQFVLPEN